MIIRVSMIVNLSAVRSLSWGRRSVMGILCPLVQLTNVSLEEHAADNDDEDNDDAPTRVQATSVNSPKLSLSTDRIDTYV